MGFASQEAWRSLWKVPTCSVTVLAPGGLEFVTTRLRPPSPKKTPNLQR